MLKISVIVPIYNAEHCLNRCIDSILLQTEKEIEVLLIDDGSTDASYSLCQELEQRDNRVRAVHKKNGGPHSARKAGIMLANADFVSFVDADDWIEPGLLEQLLSEQSATNADMVVFGYTTESTTKVTTEGSGIASGNYNKREMQEQVYPTMLCANDTFEQKLIPALYAKLFKREQLKNVMEMVDESICIGEDLACTIAYILNANKLVIKNEDSQYHYCTQDGTISSRFDKDYYKKSVKLGDFLEQIVVDRNVDYLLPNIRRYELYLIYRHIGIMLAAKSNTEFYLFLQCLEGAIQLPKIKAILDQNDIDNLKLGSVDKYLLSALKRNQMRIFKSLCRLRFYWNRCRKGE